MTTKVYDIQSLSVASSLTCTPKLAKINTVNINAC